ncbi:MAG TPA: thioredoxin TrxC [Desulfobulbus sp.]|nr:thioredoxin TrxC [Desulfobulbus sp.]
MNDAIVVCPSCGAKNRIPADKRHLTPRCGRCGAPLARADGTVVELTDMTFQQEVAASPMPVLVDFYSPTCGPCRMLAPIIEDLARKYAGRVKICKLDTSRNQMVAAQFQIRGVPTLLFFKGGQVVDQLVGAAPQAEIEQRLHALL